MRVHDVLVVGAGPSGLAVAARLRERTPSATFTDDEHQRYHWIRKHGRKMNIKNYRTNHDSLPRMVPSSGSTHCDCANAFSTKKENTDILVLDADGSRWMARWNRLFETFGIDYLRSPMFFHIDPADRDALLGYTYEEEREKELWPLPGCVGKETSKHRKKKKRNAATRMSQGGHNIDERDRKDYATPSTTLFSAHCDAVVRRYQLGREMIHQERVMDIEYNKLSDYEDRNSTEKIFDLGEKLGKDEKVFKVTTDQSTRYAHVVILAVGPGNTPSIPRIPGLPLASPHNGCAHTMQLGPFPPPHLKLKISKKDMTNMLIIGGGLTAIQIADLAIARGVDKVWLLMRGPVKVKYFDVDLEWVGKFRNVNQAAFWSADTDEERLEMILKARNGGSLTPRYRKILDGHVSCRKISLHTHTTLESAKWDEDSQTWNSILTSPRVSFPALDYIVFATGVATNIETISFLQSMQQSHPVEIMGGLPCLNDDLMWCDDVPLFVTGRLAGLRLGPGAPNLVGARVGAERIAWNIEDVLRSKESRHGDGSDVEGGQEKLEEYAAARTNRYDRLFEKDK